MKLAIYFLSISIVLIFTASCHEESAQSIDATFLPGSWNLVGFHASGTNSHLSNGQLVSASYESEGFDFASTTIFTVNPNAFSTTGSYSYEQIVNQTNGMIDRDTIVLPSNTVTGIWTVEGNALIEKSTFNTYEYTIEELTSTRLIIRLDFNNIYEIEDTPITSKGFIRQTFQR